MKALRTFALFLAAVMLLSCLSIAQAAVIDDYVEPPRSAGLMARFWFADGSAGADDDNVIEEAILALADAGFSGVEIQYLADNSDYTNEQAKLYGWGTESWRNLLKKVFRAAEKVEGGFRVDITGTSHWPPEINTIDPNDEAAATEISMALTKITAQSLADGSLVLNLPVTKTEDGEGAHFIFTDTFVSAYAAQVTNVSESGQVVLDFTSLTPLDAEPVTLDSAEGLSTYECREIDGVLYAGSPAGVPDEAYANAMGWDYAETLAAFGPEPAEGAELTVGYNHKQDAEFNRARLADWQYFTAADLSGLDITAYDADGLKAGDWVAVGVYYRGVGQVKSGGDTVTMYNRTYVPNYYDTSGVQVISDYWWNYIIDDELEAMLRANGGSIFEDSIETSNSSDNWSWDMPEEIAAYMGEDYPYADILPALVASAAKTDANYAYSFDSTDSDISNLMSRIRTDFSYVKTQLYLDQHVKAFVDFADSFGYTYRAQTGDTNANMLVGVVETDVAGKMAIAYSLMQDTNGLLSKEAMSGFTAFSYTMDDIMIEFNSNFSWGYNRLIIHGSAYPKILNGGLSYSGDWPGYPPFGSSFGEPYGYRMPYWDSFDIITDQISSTQAILQGAQLKYDLLIKGGFSYASQLEDLGWSYCSTGDSNRRSAEGSILLSDNAVVTNGVLCEDGAAYKALIVGGLNVSSVDMLERLYEFAEAGLPILFYNCNPSNVSGTIDENNDPETVAAIYDSIVSQFDNAVELPAGTTLEDTLSVLDALGVKPWASYDIPNLETTRYVDEEDGTVYYYLFNNTTANAMMPLSTMGETYKTTDIFDEWITVQGEGVPYFLDPLYRSITQAEQYIVNGDGTISVHLDKLAASDAIFLAIAKPGGIFPAEAEYVSSVTYAASNEPKEWLAAEESTSEEPETSASGEASGGASGASVSGTPTPDGIIGQDYAFVRSTDGTLEFHAFQADDYSITLSDGSVQNVVVSEVAEPVSLEDFSLTLMSWGPVYENAADMFDPATGIQTVDPAASKYTTVELGKQSLGSWSDISAEQTQLDAMGVSGMNEVSGRGVYTTTFDWTEETAGAMLGYTYSEGQITSISVNGTELPTVDLVDDLMDIGPYLVNGTNTLTIEYTSTLSNRVRVENRSLSALAQKDYGLMSVYLYPYFTEELS